jgi:transposase-like protein
MFRSGWDVGAVGATKPRIVAESYAPGAIVSEVARQHDISPQHLFAWRKAARAGALSLPADAAPLFVPVVTDLHHDGVMPAAVDTYQTRANRRPSDGQDCFEHQVHITGIETWAAPRLKSPN